MSTACDLLLLSACGIAKDHNSPSASSTSSSSNQAPAPATRRRNLLQSLKQLLRVRDTRQTQSMTSPGEPPQQPPQPPKPQVYVVGSPNPKSPFLKIAHISDTCGLADDTALSVIYEADVVVHSGNLCPNQLRKHFFRDAEFLSQVKAINEFFARLPHRYKIFVPGPNESFADPEDRERLQALLPSCVYLHDTGCVIEGVRFHGVGCAGRRFGRLSATAETRTAWSNVPDNVDVLVSHSVPTNSLYGELITQLKPKLFLYGARMHRSSRSDQPEENCVKFKDNVIFSNGHAGNSACRRGIFDFYPEEAAPRDTRLPVVSPEVAAEALRSLPAAPDAAGGGGNGRNHGLLRCILS